MPSPLGGASPTPNSDMVPNDEERNVAASQLARFGSRCRIFAPLYRQATLAGLRSMRDTVMVVTPACRATSARVARPWLRRLRTAEIPSDDLDEFSGFVTMTGWQKRFNVSANKSNPTCCLPDTRLTP